MSMLEFYEFGRRGARKVPMKCTEDGCTQTQVDYPVPVPECPYHGRPMRVDTAALQKQADPDGGLTAGDRRRWRATR